MSREAGVALGGPWDGKVIVSRSGRLQDTWILDADGKPWRYALRQYGWRLPDGEHPQGVAVWFYALDGMTEQEMSYRMGQVLAAAYGQYLAIQDGVVTLP